jgi:hypothetical protein
VLELLDGYDGGAAALRGLIDGLDALHARVIASRGRADLSQVGRAEAEVAADPGARIRFDDRGAATLYADRRAYRAGRFETPALAELRARAAAARARNPGAAAARLRLWVLDGAGPLTDIGALQATAAPGSLFQVASQLNCLESPGRFVAPVADYLRDPTQGPRASISAFPGTLVRHYAAPAPDGSRFVQTTGGRQIELLGELCAPGVAAVHDGYLRADDVADPAAFARALADRFDAIRIGLHDGVEVALGHDWAGAVDGAPHRTIAQVFTSTLAAGMYGGLDAADPAFAVILRQLQRAAYLGTLLAAAALGVDRVALTLIGGGVFANPIDVIWDAILWACDEAEGALHRDLVVAVNGRNLGEAIARDQLRRAAHRRGGGLIRFARDGGAEVEA